MNKDGHQETVAPGSGVSAARGDLTGISLTRRELIDELVAFSGVSAGDRVLDFGCGRGFVSEAMALVAGSVVGVDADTALLPARGRAGYCGALGELPFGTGVFSMVVMFHVLEHIDVGACRLLLAETRRVLKRGGLVVAGVPNCGIAGRLIWRERRRFLNPAVLDHFGSVDHRQFFTRRTFRALFDESGFTELRATRNLVLANSFGALCLPARRILEIAPFCLDTAHVFRLSGDEAGSQAGMD